MTMAHPLSTPAPAPRWLLLGSLALNLFLIGLTAALMLREPPPTDRSVRGRVERLVSALPSADAAKLRAEFGADRAIVEGAYAKYEEGREGVRAALRREPFDGAALRDAMARARGARQEFDVLMHDMIAKAAGEMSAGGRSALANWRTQGQPANK